ncbi:transcriptional regulator, LysR family [Oceanospirillum multiglobuliferum]|uniref:LysR family transcriptional regulator n=1 Tax=Oceanospirillum multiglobuliferum TaxID=64969 RepID=A0A1T4RYQ3_9GAMM|nr:LysR substrate-binding domain-containing protein [Oceanospirillum multiglobuliferum]OPX54601.1 LysR family transcriptional regulator [Oceanospirillum multiglobuliferum]SKA20828.1 transcriptional regulator, LysR family [Oceanospirillum multiglobuliferum]
MTPKWDGVSEFVAVVETGSFTEAAKRMALSTAQISRQVSQLEQRLATKLLYRTTRKVSVTEAGQLYYQHCRQVLEGLAEAERAVVHLQDTPRGKLKITAPITYGENIIAPLLNDFALRYPELDIQLVLSNQRFDLVEQGFDLAIRIGRLENSSMIAKPLSMRSLYTCAAPDYLRQYGEPHTLSELARHNCLLGTLDYWRFQDEQAKQEHHKERNLRVSGRLRYNSGTALLDAALKGLGIVQLPDFYVRDYLEQGLLVELLRNYQPIDENIWALYPHNRQLSAKVRLLVAFLEEALLSR